VRQKLGSVHNAYLLCAEARKAVLFESGHVPEKQSQASWFPQAQVELQSLENWEFSAESGKVGAL